MDNYRMIDVKDVKNLLYDFLSLLMNVIKYIIGSARRYLLLTVLVFVVVLSCGGYYWCKQQPYYKSTVTFFISSLDAETYGEMIHRLDELVSGHSYAAAAAALSITESDAMSIYKIEAKNREGGTLKNDRMPNVPIYITASVARKELFPALQAGLLKYLNSLPYVTRRNDEDKKAAAQKITYLQNDLANIDSVIFSYKVSLQRQRAGRDSSGGFLNIATLFTYKDQLEDKLLAEDRKRDILPGVEIFSDFLATDYPVGRSTKLLYAVIAGAVIISIGFSTVVNLIRNEPS